MVHVGLYVPQPVLTQLLRLLGSRSMLIGPTSVTGRMQEVLEAAQEGLELQGVLQGGSLREGPKTGLGQFRWQIKSSPESRDVN